MRSAEASNRRTGRPAALAVARRALSDSRTRTISFAAVVAGVCYVNASGYQTAYPTVAERLRFAHAFGTNRAVLLFYGKAYNLLTVGGYTAWRAGGVLTVLAGAWGLLGAVRAMRAEEDAGRAELVLASPVSRTTAYAAQLGAIALGLAALWLAGFLGLVAAGLPAGGSAYLALAIASAGAVFAGVGALTSQLAGSRRQASALASGALAGCLLLRALADTSSLHALRWITPLGWAEELRPFSAPAPLALLPLAATTIALVVIAALMMARRDLGSGLLRTNDRTRAHLGLLSSASAHALRDQRTSLLAWIAGTGLFAFVVGLVSTSIASAGLSRQVIRELRKVGGLRITTPSGYIGFTFLLLVLVVSLYCCSQIAAARHEEADELLETLLSLPLSRTRWLGGRIAVAALAAACIALSAGLFAWAGASAQNAGVSLGRLLEAAANCLPAALLFLALGALAFGLLPRAAAAIAYGLVGLAFVWELFGSLLDVPSWTLGFSPFHQVGLLPAESFRPIGAIAMLGLAAVAALGALWSFGRRDLTGA